MYCERARFACGELSLNNNVVCYIPDASVKSFLYAILFQIGDPYVHEKIIF